MRVGASGGPPGHSAEDVVIPGLRFFVASPRASFWLSLPGHWSGCELGEWALGFKLSVFGFRVTMTLMRVLISILMVVTFLPFAVGQVVEKAEPDKVIGYEVRIVDLPAEEQARINKVYPVSEDGFIELGKVGKIKVKGESAWSVVSAVREACLKAEISEQTILIMRPITKSDSNEESWFLIGGHENEAARSRRSWRENLTLFAALAKAGVVKFCGEIRGIRLYRNGVVYTYD